MTSSTYPHRLPAPFARGWHFRIAVLVALALVVFARVVPAAEPYAEMLEGLRARQWFDSALEYIEANRNNPQISAADRQVMPYEEGRLFIAASRIEFELARRNALLDKAEAKFAQFVKDNPEHELAAVAETQLGGVLVERGLALLTAAERKGPGKAEELLLQARANFEKAEPIFTQAVAKAEARFKAFQLDPNAPADVQASRERAREDLIRARLASALVTLETARSYSVGSAERIATLKKAGDAYGDIYKKYRKVLAGMAALVKQAECLKELGEHRQALSLFKQVLDNPDDERVRDLKKLALLRSLEIWTQSEKDPKYLEASEQGKAWCDAAQNASDRSEEGVGIRYLTALAQVRHAATLKAKPGGESAADLLREARRLAGLASRFPGPYRDRAKSLLQEMAGRAVAGAVEDPATFAECVEKGREAIDTLVAARASLKDPQTASLPANEQSELKAEFETSSKNGERLLRRAIFLADASIAPDEIHNAQAQLAFLYHALGRVMEAAVLAEHLVEHAPTFPASRKMALVGLDAYRQAYNAAPAAARKFERAQLVRMAETIARVWPNEPETADAWNILIAIAVAENHIDQARAYAARIPADSPRRGDAELRIGLAIYIDYKKALREPEASRPADLPARLSEAKAMLLSGWQRIKIVPLDRAQPNAATVRGLLGLCEIHLTANESAAAVEILTAPAIGPLALITAKHDAVADKALTLDVYKVTITARANALSDDELARIATEAEAFAQEAGLSDGLTNAYVGAAIEAERQMARFREQKNETEFARAAKIFESLVGRLASRTAGVSLDVRQWMAGTFYKLGSGYLTGAAKVPQQAEAYLLRASELFDQVLADPDIANAFGPDKLLRVELDNARTKRLLGKRSEAIELLDHVLQKKPTLVTAQREAALAFQERGIENPEYYGTALEGARKYKDDAGRERNRIWGWADLARRTQSDPKLSETFHEARLNVARCRMLRALGKSGSVRDKLLDQAEKDVLQTATVRPDMGGTEWLGKYDDLLKEIQVARQKEPTGLPAEVLNAARKAAARTPAAANPPAGTNPPAGASPPAGAGRPAADPAANASKNPG